MTTINEARAAIYTRFQTNWNARTNAEPFFFENVIGETPESGPWLRLAVRNTESSQETLGRPNNRRFRRSGTLFVQVFTEVNTGTQTSDQIATAVRDIFEGVSFSGLRFFSGLIRESGLDDKWLMTIVECNFDYQETK